MSHTVNPPAVDPARPHNAEQAATGSPTLNDNEGFDKFAPSSPPACISAARCTADCKAPALTFNCLPQQQLPCLCWLAHPEMGPQRQVRILHRPASPPAWIHCVLQPHPIVHTDSSRARGHDHSFRGNIHGNRHKSTFKNESRRRL